MWNRWASSYRKEQMDTSLTLETEMLKNQWENTYFSLDTLSLTSGCPSLNKRTSKGGSTEKQ